MTRVQPVAATGATFTLSLAMMAGRAVAKVWTALKNRRQVSLLAELDDRCLKDIGLIRSDVDAALCLPLHRDPSHHLIDVSGHQKPQRAGAVLNRQAMNRLRSNNAVVTTKQLGLA